MATSCKLELATKAENLRWSRAWQLKLGLGKISMTDFGISAVMNLAYDKNLQEEEESQGERGRTEERPVVWYLVLYSQGRVAHHKQDVQCSQLLNQTLHLQIRT